MACRLTSNEVPFTNAVDDQCQRPKCPKGLSEKVLYVYDVQGTRGNFSAPTGSFMFAKLLSNQELESRGSNKHQEMNLSKL